MKPPGSLSLRQPRCGHPARPPPLGRLFAPPPLPLPPPLLLLLVLLGPACAAAAARDQHWNETAGSIEGVLADEENAFQQNKSSNSKNESYSSAIQKEITLPSRLIYYINRDSETPYHILDTRARHQEKHDKDGSEAELYIKQMGIMQS